MTNMITVIARFADGYAWNYECGNSKDIASAIESATKQALYNGNLAKDLGEIEIYRSNSYVSIPWTM